MTENFENLSDYDFERLVCDLLTAEWGVRVEAFPKGRDGGVDLRVLGPTNAPLNLATGQELVVQCKHRPTSAYKDLKTELTKEAQKSISNEASRYVLATTARLTRANKKSISVIFSGNIVESDIYARDDIAALIRRHPKVEQATPKLWMSSAAVMSTLLHSIEHLRSGYLRDELRRLRRSFVETGFVTRARACLNEHGVCILAGPPGVGKTTTAHILLLQFMADGWEPIVAVGDARELEAQHNPDAKQVLFFDDFLGQDGLEAKLRTNGDAELLRLIQLVESDPTKALIMTTRDYVLRRAQQSYEKLSDTVFDTTRISIRAESLTVHEKSHILYNQLYFSPLREVASKAPSGEYDKVVRHRKFNPRLTSTAISKLARDGGPSPRRRFNRFTTEPAVDSGHISETDLPGYLVAALERPEELWDHILRYQMNGLQRDILLTRASFGYATILGSELYKAVRALRAADNRHSLDLDFDAAMAILDGDFLSVRVEHPGLVLVERIEPGLADAVYKFMLAYPDTISAISKAAAYFGQIRILAGLCGYYPPRRQNVGHFKPRQKDLELTLLRATERLFFSPGPTVVNGTLFFIERQWHTHIGERLSLLVGLYHLTGASPKKGLIELITERIISNLPRIGTDPLVQAVGALRSQIPDEWRPTRTKFESDLLAYLSQAEDMDDWSTLKDVIDIVPVTDEFVEELEREFDSYAAEVIYELVDQLENDPRGDEDETLEKITDLADRWDCRLDTSDVEELLELQSNASVDEEENRSQPGARRLPIWPSEKQQRQTEASPRNFFDLL
ncbi:nSTAND3 domain-containing NTPase [Plantactinospora sonchi]|uniref:Restriction endonuclease n=1 Tax=Plantactinospora sonchi TaxID=1544735 RepID=A0ABU7RUK0_9ACTN